MEADSGILMVEPLALLGVCSLCLNEGVVKSMLLEYTCNGFSESYTDMLYKCFSIDLSRLELGDTKKLICQLCINKLRDAAQFREQVEVSLKTLEETVKLNGLKGSESVVLVWDNNEVNNSTLVKRELDSVFGDDFAAVDDDDDDEDNMILKELMIKKERSEEKKNEDLKIVIKKRVKKENYQEIESMMAAGLFPFKIKKNKMYSCAVCREKTKTLDDMQLHVLQHNKSNINIAFKKLMYSHAQFYKTANKLRCKICTTDIENFEQLKLHIESCVRLKSCNTWKDLPFKLEKDQLDCPVCKKTFLNFVRLNTHMNIHYPNFICESCGKAFASKARLRGHMRTHEVGDFPCKYCDAVFDRVTKRENHVSKEHKAGVRYACKRCNISLPSFYARQKHLAEVHNEELKRYKCKACPQSYITPGHLSSHVRRDHLNERNHKCERCDLAFYTKNALKMHMIKHDGERIHTCSICQKSYQRKKTLREHMRIHDNDKRFVCPSCGRAFTQKCTLKGHLKVHERN